MKIAHVSDSHSYLIPIPDEADVVCHTGDFLPNHIRHFYGDEIKIATDQKFQTEWVRENLPRLKRWVGSRKFIYSSGNHDWIDPTPIMRSAGIDATCIDLRRYEHEGFIFYGFPFVPRMSGEWNLEADGEQMHRYVRRLRDELQTEPAIDVLLAHCPPYGVLDSTIVVRRNGEITFTDEPDGNRQLGTLLGYIDEWCLPKALLSGHFHKHYGVTEEFGITVSNAATTVNLIEVSK